MKSKFNEPKAPLEVSGPRPGAFRRMLKKGDGARLTGTEKASPGAESGSVLTRAF